MKRSKTLLAVLIGSAVLNAILIIAGLFWLYPMRDDAHRNGYSEGVQFGLYKGFERGLNIGRNCITDGVAGDCEGSSDFMFLAP